MGRFLFLGIGIFAAIGILIGFINFTYNHTDLRCVVKDLESTEPKPLIAGGKLYEERRLPNGECGLEVNIKSPDYKEYDFRTLNGTILHR